MNLNELSKKHLKDLTPDEIDFIKSEYKAYFDKCEPRTKALGYAVIFGGVPTDKIGLIDIAIRPQGVGLSIGPFPILNGNNSEAIAGILDYVRTDSRFQAALYGPDGEKMPLFVATRNGGKVNNTGCRLHDCKTAMAHAGRAIGFNASKIKKLYRLGDSFRVCVGGFKWDREGGIYWGEMPLMRDFPFEIL